MKTKALVVGLPVEVAYDLAEGKRNTFAVRKKPPRMGRIVIFSLEGGDAERPGLSTVADAVLESARWNGRRWVCKVGDIIPLIPIFPIKMSENICESEIPDEIIQPYPNNQNIRRWLKS